MEKKLFTKLEQIARKHTSFETLEERKRDCLDFNEIGVLNFREALLEAYKLGQKSIKNNS